MMLELFNIVKDVPNFKVVKNEDATPMFSIYQLADDVQPNGDEQDEKSRRVAQNCRVDAIYHVRRKARKEIRHSAEVKNPFSLFFELKTRLLFENTHKKQI
jgi:hypothetical protein